LTILPKLGFGHIKLASDKIIIAGHSFGAMTALRGTMIDGRIKAAICYDPWLFVH